MIYQCDKFKPLGLATDLLEKLKMIPKLLRQFRNEKHSS